MIHETLKQLTVDITTLVPRSGNPRRGNLELIKSSLEHHGHGT